MRIKHARLATALLATTAIGCGVIEIDANLSTRAALRTLLDRHAGLTVGSVFAEPFTGRLTLHGISADSGTTRITIGTLDLPLPRRSFGVISTAAASPFDDKPDEAAPEKPAQSEPDEDRPEKPAQATPEAAPASGNGVATAENVVITSGTTTYRIKRIDMTGTSLSNADLASLVDPKSTEPLEARVKKLSATAVVVPEVLSEDMSGGAERHATITNVVLSGAAAGKIASATVAGVTFTSKDTDETINGSVGPIQASGLDLTQIMHVSETVRADDSEPVLPLVDSLSASTVKVVNETKKSTFTLASLKETGVKGRPLKTDALKSPKPQKLSDTEQAALFDDMTHSFEFSLVEITGLEGQDAASGTFSMASFSMQNFASAKVGGFALRAFQFTGPQAKFGIGTVDVGPFTLPPPKGITPQGASMMVPSSAKIDVAQIDFDGVSDSAGANGTPGRVAFKIAHAGFVSDGQPGDLPTTSKMTIDNVTFDLPPGAEQSQPLIQMGYHRLDLSLGLATTYDSAGQSLMINDLTLNGANMGSVALGLHLVNVTKGLVSPNQEVVKASALAILAKGLKLDLVNDGLVDKVLAWKAKQDGVELAKEKEVLIDFFDTKLPASVNNSANAKIVGSALAKFVADPKNFHLSVESKSGLGVGSMALLSDPALLVDSLDVKASANQ